MSASQRERGVRNICVSVCVCERERERERRVGRRGEGGEERE